MTRKIYNYIRFLEESETKSDKKNNRFNKIIRWLIVPYFFYLEYLCRKNIWIKNIMVDLLTNDTVLDFLDKEDFTFDNMNRFVKKDLVEDPSLPEERQSIYPNYFKEPENTRRMIRSDYINKFTNILKNNFNYDIENYVNITTEIDIVAVQDESTYQFYKEPVYTIIFQYYREVSYREEKRRFNIWCINFCIILSILSLVLYYIIK